MSAGRLLEPGTREGASFRGHRAAVWAAEEMTSLMALCRKMRSPLPPHPTSWSPKGSAGLLQTEQGDSSEDILKPSQY